MAASISGRRTDRAELFSLLMCSQCPNHNRAYLVTPYVNPSSTKTHGTSPLSEGRETASHGQVSVQLCMQAPAVSTITPG